ncbi:SH3 domain-containing protein [uncultured Roseovarius sp.]|uniref:SH3 domain-containing protein n=1 Tax=uncultured Roseovarius sp. TaxID=293344 RepID=UPI0026308620|nr:SH3 domain-containing protein [uncultured Roseovarius sp.]
MWRFILVSFAFLGWSFYVLSGGADYEPRVQSIQARAKLDDIRPLARPGSILIAETAEPEPVPEDEAVVTRALSSPNDLDLPKTGTFEITLASVAPEELSEPSFESDPQKADTLTQVPDLNEDIADQVETLADLRLVTGTSVNMRDGPSTFYLAIGRLTKGDEIEVLENPGEGWLKIRVARTEQVGWMADWLVTAAAN